MSVHQFVDGDCTVDSEPVARPDGHFVARAVIKRKLDTEVEELWPEFKPFQTEAEAASAALLAATAWVRRRESAREG